MASDAGIANSALVKIGSRQRITSLTQTNSVPAAHCNEQFAKVRDALLEEANWKFALAWVSLTRTSTTPVAEFDYEFQKPSDFIRLVLIADNDAGVGKVPYRIAGDRIISDANELWLLYVRKETDPNVMTPMFREALAWRLAFDLAAVITDATTTRDSMERSMTRAVARAKASDSMQNFPESMPYGTWVTGRQRDSDEWATRNI